MARDSLPVGFSDERLESMERDGWTPRQVRDLIAEHRRLLDFHALERDAQPAAKLWEQWSKEKCGYCLGNPIEHVCECTPAPEQPASADVLTPIDELTAARATLKRVREAVLYPTGSHEETVAEVCRIVEA